MHKLQLEAKKQYYPFTCNKNAAILNGYNAADVH